VKPAHDPTVCTLALMELQRQVDVQTARANTAIQKWSAAENEVGRLQSEREAQRLARIPVPSNIPTIALAGEFAGYALVRLSDLESAGFVRTVTHTVPAVPNEAG
jgi:hypothetical protein